MIVKFPPTILFITYLPFVSVVVVNPTPYDKVASAIGLFLAVATRPEILGGRVAVKLTAVTFVATMTICNDGLKK